MKKTGEYTAKGTMDASANERIQLFDGKFDTAFKVISFTIAPEDVATGDDVYAKLETELSGTDGNVWDWGDNRQLAWSRYSSISAGHGGVQYNYVDEDNLIVEDLFIVSGPTAAGQHVNYMIHMEKYDISEWRGALAMTRNRSQS